MSVTHRMIIRQMVVCGITCIVEPRVKRIISSYQPHGLVVLLSILKLNKIINKLVVRP